MVENLVHPFVRSAPWGRIWLRSETRYPPRAVEAHRELVVLHALVGSAQYLVDGEVHRLRAGSLLWALSGQRHVLMSESTDFDMRVVLVGAEVFEPDGDFPPFSNLDAPDPVPPRVLSNRASEELEGIATAQTLCTDLPAQSAGLRWWLVRAWSHWRSAERSEGNRLHPAISKAVQLWRETPELPNAEVARQVGLSTGRLGRVFQQQLRQSTTEFRNEEKLKRFEELRRTSPRLSLMTLALDAGFGSYAQFFRVHVKHRGMQPRAKK